MKAIKRTNVSSSVLPIPLAPPVTRAVLLCGRVHGTWLIPWHHLFSRFTDPDSLQLVILFQSDFATGT